MTEGWEARSPNTAKTTSDALASSSDATQSTAGATGPHTATATNAGPGSASSWPSDQPLRGTHLSADSVEWPPARKSGRIAGSTGRVLCRRPGGGRKRNAVALELR